MESKTATAVGAGIVSVITPLVFPAIPLALGLVFYTVAGGLFVYAAKDEIRSRLPWTARKGGAAPLDAKAAKPEPIGTTPPFSSDVDHAPAELTEYLVRKLLAHPIHRKTQQVMRFIAANEKPDFYLEDAVRAVSDAKSYMDLKGAWAGLTRRTRKILDDPEALLIQWHESYDAHGNYLGWVGRVAELTHTSLRRHFNIS